MRTMDTQKIRVSHTYLSAMEEVGWDISDDWKEEREHYAFFAKSAMLHILTRKQRQMVLLLAEGLKWPEIASTLLISVQEVHQIIPRIRKRLKDYQQEGSRLWGQINTKI